MTGNVNVEFVVVDKSEYNPSLTPILLFIAAVVFGLHLAI